MGGSQFVVLEMMMMMAGVTAHTICRRHLIFLERKNKFRSCLVWKL